MGDVNKYSNAYTILTKSLRFKITYYQKPHMYTQEITIEINSDIEKDQLIDEFSWLMSQYHRNGQILNGGFSQFVNGSRLYALPVSPERESLNSKYNSAAVKKQIERLEKLCDAKLIIRTIGNSGECTNDTCACRTSEYFVVSAVFNSRESLISCGTCGNMVPLYKLPVPKTGHFGEWQAWQLTSMIADGFEMVNLRNDRIPSFPTALFKSIASQGHYICKEIEETTGVKTIMMGERLKKHAGNPAKETQTA